MEIKEIEALARLMKENGLTSLAFKEGEVSLKLERRQEAASFPQAEGSPFVPAPVEAPAPEQAPAQKEGTLVASPTVGVFYAAASPESQPFVAVGDQVEKGDTLCIIEAMKLMNEIPAEVSGKVAEICVSNGQVVEYGQALFRII
ncbi:MAG: acetyl-CoA carboxylase biotin carboxyl carrier protein [Acutalibacter sp.]|nr:acetyl-CoA carboxylase biotin carboxyl carrier protein [Acutalibacter sp.]